MNTKEPYLFRGEKLESDLLMFLVPRYKWDLFNKNGFADDALDDIEAFEMVVWNEVSKNVPYNICSSKLFSK